MTTIQITCRSCNHDFDYITKRGRKPVNCPKCREEKTTGSNNGETLESLFEHSSEKRSDDLVDRSDDAETIVRDLSLEDDTISNLEKELASVREEEPNAPSTEEKVSFTYEVFVSNRGFVYQGESLTDAEKKFKEYVDRCASGYGQLGFEKTTLFHLGREIKSVDHREIIMAERKL